MGTNTINDFALLKARIYEPRLGVWHADVEAETFNENIADGSAVTLKIEDDEVVMNATVFRGGLESGRWLGRLVGGAGGMNAPVSALYYRNSTFGAIIADLCTLTGETLDTANSSAEILNHQRARWQRSVGRPGHVLQSILDLLNEEQSDPGYVWRIQRDGTLFVGADAFAAAEDFEYELLGTKPHLGEAVIAPQGAPFLRPGVTFEGVEVDNVLIEVAEGSMRQRYWSRAAS